MDKLITQSSRANACTAITNIFELFEALAVGWQPKGPVRRIVAAAGKQFVQLVENRWSYPIWNMQPGDIEIKCEPYSMKGFVKFEAEYMFRGMFDCEINDDFVAIASLTQQGFDFARSGVMDFEIFREIEHMQFFNPKTNSTSTKIVEARTQ